MASFVSKEPVIRKHGKLIKNIYRDRHLYLMLVPFLIIYIMFMYRPMWGLQIAFKDYNLYQGISKSAWVGLEHFKTFLESPYFLRTLKNTLLINLYSLVFGFPMPIILALMINEARSKKFQKLVQTVTYVPNFISIVVVAGMVINFLSPSSGIVNILIEKMGGSREYFLTKPEYFRGIFTIMNIWKDTGFNTIIYIAALSAIDMQLYEACVIDGGGTWRKLWHVTLPGILPTIVIMLILKIGSLLDVGYESIILLYQPSTYETADVISSYVYRTGLQEGNYGLGAAVGLFNSAVALVLVFISNYISKKLTNTGIW
ncbi:MAG: ABC transporter permease subunit [Oscillospiraceae bacterium]